MKTLTKISSLLIFTSILFMACQKETSFEQGNSTASVGSLSVDASGNCLGAVVSGTYMKDTAIKASNYADVSVKVDSVGTYIISSDTVNGYYFKATGTFGATGTQTVRLVGGGKPLVIGTNSFRVTYNGTLCDFTVTVTAAPPPTGGSAAFTFNCTGATPTGTYVAGTPLLTAANTITLNVTVTTIGTWSVTTSPAVNGIIFSGTGTFAATGAQTIVLTGSGTPTVAGTNTFNVTGGTSACTFQCTTAAVAVPDYFPRTSYSNWSYDENVTGSGLDTFLSKVIPQTYATGGNTYNIIMYSYDVSQGFDTLGYYRRSAPNGPDYYEWGDMSYGVLDNPFRGEFIFLKDNQAAGFKWNSLSFSGPYTPTGQSTINVTLRWEFTIIQQNVTVTVNTTPYANTIQVKQELQVQTGPTTWTPAFYYQNYYAKDKGLIKQDLFDMSTGTPTTIYTDDVKRLVIY